jgi:hypothetical protein
MTSVERSKRKIMSDRWKNLGLATAALLLCSAGANAQQTGAATTYPVAIQLDEILKAGSGDPATVNIATSETATTGAAAADSTTVGSSVAAPVSMGETSLPNAPEATLPNAGLPNAPQAKSYAYEKPTQKTKFLNYLFDAWGPLPLAGAALVAGIQQAGGHPHEWGGGIGGYGTRFASDYGIGAITTTTRYGLAQLTGEDTLYYRCECTGFFPRFKHAMFSTLTGRRGEDGHRVFSVPSLVAPYAGSFTAVYAWYPGRYGAKDAFRIGNYNLLAYAGGNLVLEFLPSGEHSLLSKFHLQNHHGAPSNSKP